jgi:uncharacterized protein
MRHLIVIILIILSPLISAKIKNKMIIHTIRLLPHEDLKQGIENYIKAHRIEAAFIQTCVGSLEKVEVRYANQKETSVLNGKFEIISLVGTLSATSGSHLHLGIADSTGNTKGGHLSNGSLVYTTVEIVIGELLDKMYMRELDTTYGYKELKVKQQ